MVLKQFTMPIIPLLLACLIGWFAAKATEPEIDCEEDEDETEEEEAEEKNDQ